MNPNSRNSGGSSELPSWSLGASSKQPSNSIRNSGLSVRCGAGLGLPWVLCPWSAWLPVSIILTASGLCTAWGVGFALSWVPCPWSASPPSSSMFALCLLRPLSFVVQKGTNIGFPRGLPVVGCFPCWMHVSNLSRCPAAVALQRRRRSLAWTCA